MKKRILLVVFASVSFIYSLVDYILSWTVYDSYGYFGAEASTDSLFIMLSIAVLLAFTILNLYGYIKNINYSKSINIGVVSVLVFNASYSLFTALKIVAKAVNKLWENEPFELAFKDVSFYLVWGFVAICTLLYIIFDNLEKKQFKNI